MPRLVSTGAFLIPQRKSDGGCASDSTTGIAGGVDDLAAGDVGETAGALEGGFER